MHLSFHALLALAATACGEYTPPDATFDEQPEQLALAAGDADSGADAEADPEVTVEQIEVGGLTFDVRLAGPRDGDVVMLLHGFPQSSYEWRYQIPVLAEAGYRVVAPDLRGYSPGARPDAVDQYTLPTFVNDVLGLADAVGARRFHLVGHDVGALVAWGTAQLAGIRLRSLTVLAVPHPGAFAAELSDPRSCQSRASAWYHDVIPPTAAEELLEGEESLLRQAWADMEPDAAEEYERLLGEPEALDGALNMWRANFVDGQPQGAYPIPVVVPTLYVWGDQDPYTCREGEPLTRFLTWAPYRFEVLRDVGHWIPEDAAERLKPLLLTHLRRHRR